MYLIQPVANGNEGLFFNSTFLGLISEDKNEVHNFTKNLNELELIINYLLLENKIIYSSNSTIQNQHYIKATTKPHYLAEGLLNLHYQVK